MNYFNAKEMRQIGEKGVNIITKAMRKKAPDNLKVRKANPRRCGYNIGIFTGTKEIKIQVKSDRHNSDNLFIETISNFEKSELGGVLASNADFLCYYFFETKKLYIFNVKFLRKWVLTYRTGYDYRDCRTPLGNNHYTTSGFLVPITHLSEHSYGISDLFEQIMQKKGDCIMA